MLEQLPLFGPTRTHDGVALRSSYVPNRVERPADIPRLRESAETMERRVLAWFEGRFGVRGYIAQTPTMCADALGLKLTTVRPRITQLVKAGRLERCAWVPRKPTEDGGSEGWFRFKEEA